VATGSGDVKGGGAEFSGDSENRNSLAYFDAFYEFAFPRVYYYAKRRMENEAQAQMLCRRVLTRAVTALGGLGAREQADPTELAFWLFCLARTTADQLSEHPELLEGSDLDGSFEDHTLEILHNARAASVTSTRDRIGDKSARKSN
jgi:hypothetical protein